MDLAKITNQYRPELINRCEKLSIYPERGAIMKFSIITLGCKVNY